MKRMFILLSILLIMVLTGCSVQTPPYNPSSFAPIYNNAPYGCNNTVEGNIYYNNVTHTPYICNSTDWRMIGN